MGIKQKTAAIACTFLALVGFSFAQSSDSNTEEAIDVANQAIAKLAAWENGKARKILEKEKAKYGSSPDFKTAWALLEIQENAGGAQAEVSKGLKTLDEATKGKGSSAAASFWEGEVLYQQRKRDEADSAWEKAADIAGKNAKADPQNATEQFYLGASLVRTKKFEEARKALTKAEKKGFDSAMVKHQIGLSYLFEENWEAAKESFTEGLEIAPRYAPMYFWRAMAWEKTGRTDNMLVDLDQYIKLAPNGPDSAKAKAVLKSAGR